MEVQIMKINRINTENLPKTTAPGAAVRKKTEFSAYKDAPGDQISDAPPLEDTVEISVDAKKKTKDFQKMLDQMRNEMHALREGLRQANEASEGAAEAWKEKIKCLQIAMRIMSGNIVPIEDHRYLREKDPELYSRSITLRIEKEDPDEYDRLSEDEKDKKDNAMQGTPDVTPPTVEMVAGSADTPQPEA